MWLGPIGAKGKTMQICRTKAEMRALVRQWRKQGEQVGLVPTMGFLHEGHLSLVRMAQDKADRVVVSIFVNPTQFGPNEDLDSYPRDEARDLALLEAEGVDAVLMPDVAEMYATMGDSFVEVPALSHVLQGALRPGHFRGVTTVVTKLFNIVTPDVAVFGEKDYQQLTVIQQMVRDLDVPVEIIGHPTVREADGLAMSSRNVRLSPTHRAQAVALSKSLKEADALMGNNPTVEELDDCVRTILAEASDGEIKSVDIRDARSLDPLTGPIRGAAVLLLAVKFGSVLLIDQHVVYPD